MAQDLHLLRRVASMHYYDHGMLGATLSLAVGAQRREGWPVVVLAGLAGMVPDWDALAAHISHETYLQGHRVWGHNVFAVALAGMILGGLGWWIRQTLAGRAPTAATHAGLGWWIALATLIMLSHPLMDVLYCGPKRIVQMPVALFWPLVDQRFGQPWVPWTDAGATWILASGLLLVAAWPKLGQRWAAASLLMLATFVGVRGLVP